jgi:RNA polymerase sigma-70 factor (ECF subfamily)
MSESDRILKCVLAAQAGDLAAYGELIELTQDRLMRFSVLLAGNRELAQDLCQEVYVKLFDALKKLKEPEKFNSWLFRVTKNLFIDNYRSEMPTESLTDDEEFKGSKLDRIQAEQAGGEPPASASDTVIQVRDALNTLGSEDRVLILLVDMEGHSYQEAAEIIGISENSARSRLHRARKKFLNIYNAE